MIEGKQRRWAGVYAILGIAVGIGLLLWLISRYGQDLDAAAVWASMPVVAIVVPWFLVPLWAATESWRCLFSEEARPARRPSFVLTWIGLGVNWLLPVAMIGGELVKARLALHKGWSSHVLLASLVGDKTIQVATQMLYTLTGIVLLVWLTGRSDGLWQSMALLSLFSAAVYAFYRLQKAGLFGGLAAKLSKLIGERDHIHIGAARLDQAMGELYQRRRSWWWGVAFRMLFRLTMAVEVIWVMWWLDVPITPFHAVALESLAQGARAAAFFIPAGLGAQEGGLVAVGLLLGLPAEALLTLALVKRLRELIVGGLGLLLWQAYEGRRWWQRRT